MARKPGKGLLGKGLTAFGVILIIFCSVYIVMDIMAKSSDDSKINVIGTTVEKASSDLEKVSKEIDSLEKNVARQISDLQRENQKLQRAIAEMSFKIKDTGADWKKNYKTGSSYCLTPYPLPWHLAQDWAKQQGGNLVMVNDEDENKWLVDTFGGKTEYWIGLTDEGSEGKWFWTIGSPAQYFNWLAGEPDNYKNLQHYGIINCQSPGKWNDVVANDPRIGIVEKK